MNRSAFLSIISFIAFLAPAAGAQELCDILYNDKTPVGLGHATKRGGHIEWVDVRGSSSTYDKPPYWFQAKIKNCSGVQTAAIQIGPMAFGLTCKTETDCTVSDPKLFTHFISGAKKDDVVTFREKPDMIQMTFKPAEPFIDHKKKGGHANGEVTIEKRPWIDFIQGKGSAL